MLLCGPEEQSMDLMAAPTSRAAPIWRPRVWQMARDPARLITCWIPTTMKSFQSEMNTVRIENQTSPGAPPVPKKLIVISVEEP